MKKVILGVALSLLAFGASAEISKECSQVIADASLVTAAIDLHHAGIDPATHKDLWLKHAKEETLPVVLAAYNNGEKSAISGITRDAVVAKLQDAARQTPQGELTKQEQKALTNAVVNTTLCGFDDSLESM